MGYETHPRAQWPAMRVGPIRISELDAVDRPQQRRAVPRSVPPRKTPSPEAVHVMRAMGLPVTGLGPSRHPADIPAVGLLSDPDDPVHPPTPPGELRALSAPALRPISSAGRAPAPRPRPVSAAPRGFIERHALGVARLQHSLAAGVLEPGQVPPPRLSAPPPPPSVMPLGAPGQRTDSSPQARLASCVAVLLRAVAESNVAEKFASWSLGRCFKEVLRSLYLEWDSNDDIVMAEAQPHEVVAHLSRKFSCMDALQLSAELQHDSVISPTAGASRRMLEIQRARTVESTLAVNRRIAARLGGRVPLRYLAEVCFRAWRGHVSRLRAARAAARRLGALRDLEELRVYVERWRMQVAEFRTAHAAEREDAHNRTMEKRVDREQQLNAKVRQLNAKIDELGTLKDELQEKYEAMITSPAVIDLRQPVRCPEGPVKHGVIEFRNLTVSELEAIQTELAEESGQRAASVATIEARGLEPAMAELHLGHAARAVKQMGDLLRHPYPEPLGQLMPTLAKAIAKRGGAAVPGHYTVLGVRTISELADDAAARRGRGFINRREFVLSWANLRVLDGFPHGSFDVSRFLLREFDESFLDCRAYLYLICCVVPHGEVRELTIDDIADMPPQQCFAKVAAGLAATGLYQSEEVLQRLHSGRWSEADHTLLLAQLYVYDHLSARVRRELAVALATGGPQPALAGSFPHEPADDTELPPSLVFMTPRRRMGSGAGSQRGGDRAHRQSIKSAGMMPDTTMERERGSPSAAPAEIPPAEVPRANRLVFYPAAGMRVCPLAECTAEAAVQTDPPPPPQGGGRRESGMRSPGGSPRQDDPLAHSTSMRLGRRGSRRGSAQGIPPASARSQGTVRAASPRMSLAAQVQAASETSPMGSSPNRRRTSRRASVNLQPDAAVVAAVLAAEEAAEGGGLPGRRSSPPPAATPPDASRRSSMSPAQSPQVSFVADPESPHASAPPGGVSPFPTAVRPASPPPAAVPVASSAPPPPAPAMGPASRLLLEWATGMTCWHKIHSAEYQLGNDVSLPRPDQLADALAERPQLGLPELPAFDKSTFGDSCTLAVIYQVLSPESLTARRMVEPPTAFTRNFLLARAGRLCRLPEFAAGATPGNIVDGEEGPLTLVLAALHAAWHRGLAQRERRSITPEERCRSPSAAAAPPRPQRRTSADITATLVTRLSAKHTADLLPTRGDHGQAEQVLREHRDELYRIYRYYTLLEPEKGLALTLSGFLALCVDLGVAERGDVEAQTSPVSPKRRVSLPWCESGDQGPAAQCYLARTWLEVLFMRCNWPSSDDDGVDIAVWNPPLGLTAPQFSEILLRLAVRVSEQQSGEDQGAVQQLRSFLEDTVLPRAVQSSIDAFRRLRDDPKVRGCLAHRKPALRLVFDHFCGATDANEGSPEARSPQGSPGEAALTLVDFETMLTTFGYLPERVTKRTALEVFVVVQGADDDAADPRMDFGEFLWSLMVLGLVLRPSPWIPDHIRIGQFVTQLLDAWEAIRGSAPRKMSVSDGVLYRRASRHTRSASNVGGAHS
eukprot:TRINITY_DN21694_c0_g1_i2.p1 TRINITY_DN21694_c0_g1~~TRINITY_DN21694_c0_g1_i2.p1  ORF type:complete len:1557 (+),score=351.86 TRINITY_DN21694_c0_g1_i2:77-4672(+)